MAHTLLVRQLRRLGLTADAPPSPEAWQALLERVDRAYEECDAGRYLLERSMDLSSEEMRTLNERLRASQAALAAEHGRLQATFASLADGVCVLDTDACCQLLNPAAEELFGVTLADARGLPLDRFVRGVDVAWRAVASTRRLDDVRLERRDTRSFAASLVVAPIWHDDVVQGTVLVIRDVTRQQQMELELRQAQKLQSVGRLAAGIAHEINTPIQFVNDSVTFVRESMESVRAVIEKYRLANRSVLDGVPSPEHARAAAGAEEAADLDYVLANVPKALDRALDGLARVAAIVRSMKEFAHPDQKQMRVIDLNEAIESTLRIARSEYKYVADLETDLGELPRVTCHAGEINQAILNIVVNAAHAIAEANAGKDRRGTIRVSTRRHEEFAEIAISDNGTGIPEAIRHRIFEPFFTTKDVGKGTGQGLPISRSVVEDKHRGSLKFESTEGKGTTFFIRLPIAGPRVGALAPK